MKSWIKKPEGLPSFYLLSSSPSNSEAEMKLKLKRSRFARQRQIAFDAEHSPPTDSAALAPSLEHPPPSAPSSPPGPRAPSSTPLPQLPSAPAAPIPTCPLMIKILLVIGVVTIFVLWILANIGTTTEQAGRNRMAVSTEPTPHRSSPHRHRAHPRSAQAWTEVRSGFAMKKDHKPQ